MVTVIAPPPAQAAASTVYQTAKLRLDPGTYFYNWKASCPAGTVMDASPASSKVVEISNNVGLEYSVRTSERERVWAVSNISLANAGVIRMSYTCIGNPIEQQRQIFPDVEYDCNVNTTSCDVKIESSTTAAGAQIIASESENCNRNPEDTSQNVLLNATRSTSVSSQYSFMEGSQVQFQLNGGTGGLTGNISAAIQQQSTWTWAKTAVAAEALTGYVSARYFGELIFTPKVRKTLTNNTLTYRVGVYDDRPNGDQKVWTKKVEVTSPVVRSDGTADGRWTFRQRHMTAAEESGCDGGIALYGPTHNKTYIITARNNLKSLHVSGGALYPALPVVTDEVDSPRQQWVLTRTDLPDGKAFTYTIKNASSGMCLRMDELPGPDSNSRQVYQANCSTTDIWQQWKFRSMDNGWKQIISAGSGIYMLSQEIFNKPCGTRGLALGEIFAAKFSAAHAIPQECMFGLRQTQPTIA
ncbi:RICIN domain-containing protein [Streptomyces sp. NPDC085932]|uniref:RICIN domain-containing protein n=1 Tax=Streptomyces sp. NPDC085932 TaxID=3365741 RepID=UPI0037D12A1E